jgi:hypothetical protein
MAKASNPVRIVRQVSFDCGCLTESSLLGDPSEWRVIPCVEHTKDRERIAKLAHRTFVDKYNEVIPDSTEPLPTIDVRNE